MPKAFLSNFVKGANPSISHILMDDNALKVQNGLVTSYKIGAMLKRLGYSRVGDVAETTKAITGLFDFQQDPDTQKILQTVNDSSDDDTQLFYNNAGTWTEITAAETAWANKANINVEMESFINYCFFVGHGATDGFLPVGSLTGTTFSETTNIGATTGTFTAATTDIITDTAHGLLNTNEITLTTSGTLPAGLSLATNYYVKKIDANTFNVSTSPGGANVDITDTGSGTHTWTKTAMPQAKYIVRYRDRLYIANCSQGGTAQPFRVYFSSVPLAGAITWTVGLNFFDIDYSEQITGLATNWDLLLMFTKRKTYFYDQNQKKELWSRGCDAHRSIAAWGNYVIFANRDGVWMSQNGGEPQNIAGPVIDFIRNGTPANFFAKVIDEEYNMYVGTVTVDGVTYANTNLIFNIPTLSWRWEELADDIKVYEVYDNSGDDRLYMGDSAGIIWDKSKYTDTTPIYQDSSVSGTGVAIPVNAETKPYFFDDPSITKRLKKITVIADRAAGVEMKARIYDVNTRALSSYFTLGQLDRYITVFEGPSEEFNFLQFEFSEYSSNEYFSILAVIVEYDVVGEKPISK